MSEGMLEKLKGDAPILIKILSVGNLLGGALTIIIGFMILFGGQPLSFIPASMIVGILTIIIGIISYIVGKDLLNRKLWAYFFEIILIFSGLISSTYYLVKGSLNEILPLVLLLVLGVYLVKSKRITTFFGLTEQETLRDLITKFKAFLKEDTPQSWTVSLMIILIFIRLIFFPALSFITQTSLPLVVVESCSMYHQDNFEGWWSQYGSWYEQKGISKEEFQSFSLKGGLNKGDIIFVWGRSKYNLGDIIIFLPNKESSARHPIIHRIVTNDPIGTKGDNGKTNPAQLTMSTNSMRLDETSISDDRIIGKAAGKIPYVGWIKLIFFEFSRNSSERGFCK